MTKTVTVPIIETDDDGYAPDYDGDRYVNAEYDFENNEVSIEVLEK